MASPTQKNTLITQTQPKLNDGYYAVIFTNQQSDMIAGYQETAALMESLAKQQSGYIGMDHARAEIGITISYWETLEDIAKWKAQNDHQMAQHKGIKDWYSQYTVRICKVEREYSFEKVL